MSTAAVFGCTGAVGSQILATLLATDAFPSIKTISRRLPSSQSPKLQSIQESNTSKWPAILSSLTPTPSVVFNALGTTRTAAGGTKYQWLIDHDLCIDNARAARNAGVKTYVFVSSGGTRWPLAGYFPYLKMKIGVEDAIQELGFENAVILKPGVIIGRDSSNQKAPLVEKLIEGLSQGIRDKIGMSTESFDSS
jgi:hypothetical protein